MLARRHVVLASGLIPSGELTANLANVKCKQMHLYQLCFCVVHTLFAAVQY